MHTGTFCTVSLGYKVCWSVADNSWRPLNVKHIQGQLGKVINC